MPTTTLPRNRSVAPVRPEVAEVHIFKAYGGDRAANLEGIADALDSTVNRFAADRHVDRVATGRLLLGYANQLRIVARELEARRSAEGDASECEECGADLGAFRQGAANPTRCDRCLDRIIAASKPRSHPLEHRDADGPDAFEQF